MASDDGNSHYGLPSRVLAAFLSPWFLLVAAALILLLMYTFYYKPRLHHAYRSYPDAAYIYLTPPIIRRRRFNRDPVEYLRKTRVDMAMSNIYWLDSIGDYGMCTLITQSDALIHQFLATDSKDGVSWDAALRHVWRDLFRPDSPFGRRSQFYYASRWCLVNGFSREKTSLVSSYSATVEREALRCLHNASNQDDLLELADSAVSRSLLAIIFGTDCQQFEKLASILDSLNHLLVRTSSRSDRKTAIQLADEFRATVRSLLQNQMNSDVEARSGGVGDDYLSWLLTNTPQMRQDEDGRSNANSHSNNNSEAGGSDRGSNTIDDNDEVEKTRREQHLLRDLPDHLLVTLLQTRLLCAVGVLWNVYSAATLENAVSPDPLLLVRKARKEVLIGSTIIPKNAFVAVSPVLERLEGGYEGTSSGYPRGSTPASSMLFFNNGHSHSNPKRDLSSTTELSLLTSTNSLNDLTQTSDTASTVDGSAFASVNHSRSTSSFAPLLRHNHSRRQSSVAGLSEMGGPTISEADSAADSAFGIPNGSRSGSLSDVDERHYRSKRGSWTRRYPQAHLISLVVGAVSTRFSDALTITGSASVHPRYLSARGLWLPLPDTTIACVRRTSNSSHAPPRPTRSLTPPAPAADLTGPNPSNKSAIVVAAVDA
ncbi:hypothetical protein PYCC9005_000818 [Savitreella phatthalungensis]